MYCMNGVGIATLQRLLPNVDMRAFPLAHHHGRAEVLHLHSLLNPISPKLAVAYLPLLPMPLVELLEKREINLVEIPNKKFETIKPNILNLNNKSHALALTSNDKTRRRLEAAGVEVLVYDGDEISRKGDGGPTCLTLPLEDPVAAAPRAPLG